MVAQGQPQRSEVPFLLNRRYLGRLQEVLPLERSRLGRLKLMVGLSGRFLDPPTAVLPLGSRRHKRLTLRCRGPVLGMGPEWLEHPPTAAPGLAASFLRLPAMRRSLTTSLLPARFAFRIGERMGLVVCGAADALPARVQKIWMIPRRLRACAQASPSPFPAPTLGRRCLPFRALWLQGTFRTA